jgi:hypothetical protein
MPSFEIAGALAPMRRAIVVAIVHLVILVVVLLATPIWVCAVFKIDPALKLLRVLHAWSRDSLTARDELVATGSARR